MRGGLSGSVGSRHMYEYVSHCLGIAGREKREDWNWVFGPSKRTSSSLAFPDSLTPKGYETSSLVLGS